MFDPATLNEQIDIAARLVLSAILGAIIGLERELRAHPAGIRTHLLVSLGSALFTVVSIFGFLDVAGLGANAQADPTRVAAQVVSGIGFLGAGAIIKYGTSIRGLTTAGSLWATAAIGMAAGAGMAGIAIVGWAVVLFSLWPLDRIVERIQSGSDETIRVRLRLRGLRSLGQVTDEFAKMGVEVTEVRGEWLADDRYLVELDLRPSGRTRTEGLIRRVGAIRDVESVEAV
jgi:uncharacterized membrane protein YhiD involved in acid resistance